MSTKKLKGFTLLELMVVIAIMGIIATVSIFNYSKFNSSLSLTNLAYEVALTIREAQVFGGSVKVSGTSNNNFDNAYGVHFSTASDFNKARFISFVDSAPLNTSPVPPGDERYGGNFTECAGECITIHKLARGNIVSAICKSKPQGSNNLCPNGQSGDSVDITFLRPNLDARIVVRGNQVSTEKEVYVVLSAPDATIKTIKIQSTGQIAVLD